MMAAGANSLLRCIFEGCIQARCSDIDQRPYHRNCKCALHRRRFANPGPRPNISYPTRRPRRLRHGLSLAADSASPDLLLDGERSRRQRPVEAAEDIIDFSSWEAVP
ncbi:hypothetical protein ZIOFF_069392 [Zingiber officinale]|uniref:Uncharacterized protein n=1 Tax=Zingiber officinale TaxID=94328 RepID=A0A8J5CDL3_ZINOF|nr:hypothetical protein ZIOFF_069392 [Zingiber officinale]